MKKLILSAIVSLSIVSASKAQTTDINNTPINDVFSFLGNAGTNLMVIPYGTYWQSDTGAKFGGGIALAYHLSDYVVPTLRIDVLDGVITMPSGSCQLQYPLNLGKGIVLSPFLVGGLATPISGRGTQNGSAIGIVGAGVAFKVSSRFDVVVDYEKWTGYSGNQLRLGVLFKL